MSTNKRQALGRGLSALLENVNTDVTSKTDLEQPRTVGSVAHIPVSNIEANPFQPRTDFDKEALIELAQSIKEHGLIQPVTVRKLGYDKYQLISGERRFKASQAAGLKEIPAYIRIANDQAMLEMAIIENIQRENLNPIEIGMSFKRLLEECNLTQEQLSERVSKQRSSIANYIRLLKLPEEIQIALRDRKITFGHARAVVNIDNRDVLQAIYKKIIEEGLSVRQVEDMVRHQNSYKKEIEAKKEEKKTKGSLSFNDQKIRENLTTFFKTKIDFSRSRTGNGKIVINFKNDEELTDILNKIS